MTGHSANPAGTTRRAYLLSAEERKTLLDLIEIMRSTTEYPEKWAPKLDAAEARLR